MNIDQLKMIIQYRKQYEKIATNQRLLQKAYDIRWCTGYDDPCIGLLELQRDTHPSLMEAKKALEQAQMICPHCVINRDHHTCMLCGKTVSLEKDSSAFFYRAADLVSSKYYFPNYLEQYIMHYPKPDLDLEAFKKFLHQEFYHTRQILITAGSLKNEFIDEQVQYYLYELTSSLALQFLTTHDEVTIVGSRAAMDNQIIYSAPQSASLHKIRINARKELHQTLTKLSQIPFDYIIHTMGPFPLKTFFPNSTIIACLANDSVDDKSTWQCDYAITIDDHPYGEPPHAFTIYDALDQTDHYESQHDLSNKIKQLCRKKNM